MATSGNSTEEVDRSTQESIKEEQCCPLMGDNMPNSGAGCVANNSLSKCMEDVSQGATKVYEVLPCETVPGGNHSLCMNFNESCNYSNLETDSAREKVETILKHAPDSCKTCLPSQNGENITKDVRFLEVPLDEMKKKDSQSVEFLCVENLHRDLDLSGGEDQYVNMRKKKKRRRKISREGDAEALRKRQKNISKERRKLVVVVSVFAAAIFLTAVLLIIISLHMSHTISSKGGPNMCGGMPNARSPSPFSDNFTYNME